jgi:hypothetical protein
MQVRDSASPSAPMLPASGTFQCSLKRRATATQFSFWSTDASPTLEDLALALHCVGRGHHGNGLRSSTIFRARVPQDSPTLARARRQSRAVVYSGLFSEAQAPRCAGFDFAFDSQAHVRIRPTFTRPYSEQQSARVRLDLHPEIDRQWSIGDGSRVPPHATAWQRGRRWRRNPGVVISC